MRSYLIETSIIIDYLRGKESTVALVDSLEGNLASSYISLAELYEGLYRITNRKVQEDAVRTFFVSLDNIYGVNLEVALEFGRLRANLKSKGTIIEDLDLFIAATCIAYDLILVTDNKKHFSHVPGLLIKSSF